MRDETSPRRPHDPAWRSRTARRSSTPEAMAALRDARLSRGWTMTRAARETGVSRPMLSLLERGQRRPSQSLAEDLISSYCLDPGAAEALRDIAIAFAGRDSPYRSGIEPAWQGNSDFPPAS